MKCLESVATNVFEVHNFFSLVNSVGSSTLDTE